MNRMSIYLLDLGAFLVASAELVVAGILNEVAADLHVSIALAGQLITAYSLAFAIGTPILIALTSRVGRKQLLIVTLAVFAIGSAASFFSSRYEALLAARVVLGLSAGVYCVVAISSVAKLVPPDKMGSAIGTIALAFGSALTLGVPIGIAISHWMDWRMIFALLGLASMLLMLGLIRLLPPIEGDAPATLKQQLSVLNNPVIVTGFFLSFFANISSSLVLTYLNPFLMTILHMNDSGVGVMMFILGIVGMIGSRLGKRRRRPMGSRPDDFVHDILICGGSCFTACLYLILPRWAGIARCLGLIALYERSGSANIFHSTSSAVGQFYGFLSSMDCMRRSCIGARDGVRVLLAASC